MCIDGHWIDTECEEQERAKGPTTREFTPWGEEPETAC
jgi:hypothetical protein